MMNYHRCTSVRQSMDVWPEKKAQRCEVSSRSHSYCTRFSEILHNLRRAVRSMHSRLRSIFASDPGFACGAAPLFSKRMWKMSRNIVPDIVVGRLPIYLRMLDFLVQEGRQITSSQELGDRLGISSAQIRKDLSHFGEFGKQGTGYNVAYLRDQLKRILHMNQEWNMVLIGAGDLGHAIAHYQGFAAHGFHIVGVFDNDPAKVGKALGKYVVQGMEDLQGVIEADKAAMGIIAVPAAAARQVADLLIGYGVRALLNYAPITLTTPHHVKVQYIDPVALLQHMAYYLPNGAGA